LEEFVVIGAGLAGAATAWRLTQRGHQVVVLERTEPGNHRGSSHGSARIFRYAYSDQLYTDLVVRAKTGWDELQRRSGTTLITPTGCVDHGALRNPRLLAANLAAAGVEHELLPPAQAHDRWPQLAFTTEVLWHPGAGVLDAISTVRAMLDLAVASGNAQLRTTWTVSGIDAIAGGYRIRSEHGDTVEAANIVVAAGGWFPPLLADLALPSAFLNLFPQLQVRQEQAVHFPYRPADPDGQPYPPWPTFIYKGPDIETYGLPGGRDAEFRGQKVAEFNGGRVIPSALAGDGIVDPAARARLVDYAEQALPGVDPQPYAETTCLFTNTPTDDFVFDRADAITVVSACSGHGGKFAPLIGELAADLAAGVGSVPDVFRVRAHAAAAV
jgi:sarcosine oxidase